MTSYALLLALALALNATDRKMLALTLIVGAGIFLPIPASNFYLVCILVEITVALVAIRIDAQASWLIVRLSMLLCAMHALGWLLDGYPPASPYHAGVKALEHAELLLCCLFSNPIAKRWLHA